MFGNRGCVALIVAGICCEATVVRVESPGKRIAIGRVTHKRLPCPAAR